MSDRYFEIIITSRQLMLLVVAMVALVLFAFLLGIGVQVFKPASAQDQGVAWSPTATPSPLPVFATPTPWPTSAPMVEAVVPTEVPTTVPPRPTAIRRETNAVPAATASVAQGRWIQVSAVSRADQAESLRQKVVAVGYTAKQVVVQPAFGGKYRVRVGPFPNEESANRVAGRLRAEGFPGVFVVKPGE